MTLKKTLLVAFVLLLALALGITAVLAQEEEPQTPPFPGPGRGWQGEDAPYGMPHGYGMMGRGYGMMGGWNLDGVNLLEIVAEKTGLSVDEVTAQLAEGMSIAELVGDEAVLAEIVASFGEAHAAALQEAVDAGSLSEEQAQWMQEHMTEMIEWRLQQPFSGAQGGFGPGGCHGGFGPQGASRFGGRGFGMMGRGWQGQAPVAPGLNS